MNDQLRVLRAPAVEEATGMRHTAIDEMVAAGEFPPPAGVRDGGRAKIWFENEIRAWQAWRRAVRDGVAKPKSAWRDYLDGDAMRPTVPPAAEWHAQERKND